jgi:hypothetical protein
MEIEGGESASYCPLCSGVVADEKGKCAQCGNPQMDEFKVQSTTITVQKGKAPKQIGDADYDIPDSLEMTVIGETDAIGEALITRRERMIPRCVLEDALGISNLPDTATPDSLHYKKIFEDKEDTSGMKEFKKLHYEELWISPAVYTSYRFPSPVQTNSGQTIPAQTRAKELFPHGFYFTRVKKRICQLFPQSAGDCLSHAVNSIGEGFHGQGEWDLNELQDQATELTSLKMNSAMLDSTSPLMVREGVVDTEAFENKVGQVVPVGQDASERSLDDIMRRVPMTGLSKEVYALSEETSGKMQHRVGAWSTQSDAPDVQAQGTATGIATIARQSLGRRGPQLQNYAQMEIDQAYQKLEQRQKYWPKKMYEQFALEIGSDAVKWFMNCNVRQDISITVAPGSWMPALDEDKKADFQAFLTLIGPLLLAKGDPKIIDDVIREGNNIFGNGSLNFADISQENVEARLRLDALQDVGSFTEQQFGQFILDPTTGDVNSEALNVAYAQTAKLLKIDHIQEDPQDIFATLPLDVMLDDHQEFIEAYKDWLKSAEGRAASIFVRTLVRELANYHIQAESFEAYKMKQYGNLAQLPDLQAGVIADQVQTEQDQMNQPPPAQPAPAPQPSPAQQIAQGINFKDLPPEAQHQLAQSAGINVGAPAFKAHAERQNPQPNAHP